MEDSGIYRILNIGNGKFYIGSSANIYKRWKQHLVDLNKNRHTNRHLQLAWNKYGAENFKFEIVEYESEEKLVLKEQYYLDLYRATEVGYNICPIAASTLGRPMPEAAKQKLSRDRKGIPRSKSVRENISRAAFRRRGKQSPLRGRKQSEATKMKKSIANSNPSEETRPKISDAKRVKHKILNNQEVKYCSRCTTWLDCSEFAGDKEKWDGLQSRCKLCESAAARQRYYQRRRRIESNADTQS
jgi:group I intron endonuclease